MKKRSFLKRVTGALAIGLSPFAVKAQQESSNEFKHIVFFWMNNPKDKALVKKFKRGTESFFKKVDVIQSYHIGEPAGTPRDVVDNSYSVCAVVTFNSKEDQDIYQAHQAHLDYIEEWKEIWKKVQVYDSWNG